MVNQVSPDVASLLMWDADTLAQQGNAQVIDPDLGVVVPQWTIVNDGVAWQNQQAGFLQQPDQGQSLWYDWQNSPAPITTESRTQEQVEFEEWKKQRWLDNNSQDKPDTIDNNANDYYGDIREELDNKINELFNDVQNSNSTVGDDNQGQNKPEENDVKPNDLDTDTKNNNNDYKQLQEKYEALHKIAVEESEEKKWLKHSYEKLEESYKELINKAEFLEQSMRNRTNVPAPLQDVVYYYEDYMKSPDNKLSEMKAVTVWINFLENITGIDLSPYLASYNGNPKVSSGSNYSSGGSSTVPHIQPRRTNEPQIQSLTQDVF